MADENSNTDCTGISQSEPLVTANDSETLVPEENSQDGTAEQRTNGGEIDGSSGKSVKESSPFDESSSAGPSAALDHAFGLPSQPNNAETSREGNNCAISEVINVTTGQQGLPIAEQSETGTPIHSHSDISVEIPCQGTDFTYYASVQHLATNEQCFSVHFVCTKLFQENRVSRRIKRMQEQQEIKLVPIGDEYLCQCENQYFHTAFIDTHMHLTIKFQLLKQVHRKFRIMHSQIADKATLQHVLSLAHHRVPVAIAKVFIKCLAGPDEPPCQDHLRLIVQYGDTTNHMLIPIWMEDEPSAMGNNSETLGLELNSEARSSGSGDRGEIDERRKCRCTRGPVPFRRQANDGGKARCRRCGKAVEESEARSRLNSSQLEDSSSVGPLAGEVFSNGLPSLPYNAETNREGNNCDIGVDTNATGESRLPTAEQETRTPVHSNLNSSVQIPHEGTDFTYYVSVQHYPATKEQCFSLHFVSTNLFQEKKVAKRIQELQQEIKLVPIGDEYLCQREIRHFHTAFIDTHMDLTIKFQLVSVNEKFIIMHARTVDKASLQRILALGQYRIPGAIANVFVKCVGNPGELCEDHLRVILQYGDTIRHMLFSFWSSG